MWKEQKKCASCHQIPMALWSLNEARRLGFATDEQVVPDLTAWVFAADDPGRVFPKQPQQDQAQQEPTKQEPAKEEPVIINQAALLLALGIEAGRTDAEATREGLRKLLAAVMEQQRPDGSWGVLYIWEPIGSTPDVITSFVLLSLAAPNAPDLGQAGQASRDKGLAWLAAQGPGATVQAVAARMLVGKRFDRPAAEWQPLKQQILDQQQPNGGWRQAAEMESDAYTTGLMLYALAEVGVSPDDPAIAKARRYLIASQEEAGSWPMESRIGGPRGISATDLAPISYSGTAWAVMGLMRSGSTGKGK